MGRVAVIGGSEDYTGAPYFSAMASAKLGADMVMIFHAHAKACNILTIVRAMLFANRRLRK